MKGINRLSILTLIALLFSNQLSAGNSEYLIGAGLTYYENIRLVEEPVDSEMSQTLRGKMTFTEDDANLVANVIAKLDVINYKNNQVADRNRGQLVSNALWIISPEQFEWYVSDIYGQTALSTRSADSPSNEQNANAFITGPNYIMNLSSRSELKFKARYANNYFEERVNNSRLRGIVSWQHEFNNIFDMRLNYDFETIDYAEFSNVLNNDRTNVFLKMTYKSGLNSAVAEVGTTAVDYDRVGDIKKPRYLFTLKSQRTNTLDVSLNYSNILTDTAGELSIATDGDNANPDDPLITTSNDTFTRETFRFIWNDDTLFGNYKITLFNTDYVYSLRKDLDREIQSLNFYSIWNMRSDSKLVFRASYYDTLYSLGGVREDKDSIYSFLYSYKARRNFNLRFGIRSKSRESNALEQSYDDLSVLVSLEYVSQ